MKNSKEFAKSKGVIVFAFNTDKVNYVDIADQTSRLTQHYLQLPITLITDLDADPSFDYDKIIRLESKGGNFRVDNGHKQEWRNFGRYMAYDLSPYDTSILLDGDYLVLDQSLLNLVEQDFDYRLMHKSHSYNGQLYQEMGSMSLPFVWATVVLFRKSPMAKHYFDLISRIQKNYAYYKTLYNCNGSYRNDYAFAIANMILNGHSVEERQSIPWSMLTIEEPINEIKVKNDFLVVSNNKSATVISRQNIHVMDKNFLMSSSFREFVNNAI